MFSCRRERKIAPAGIYHAGMVCRRIWLSAIMDSAKEWLSAYLMILDFINGLICQASQINMASTLGKELQLQKLLKNMRRQLWPKALSKDNFDEWNNGRAYRNLNLGLARPTFLYDYPARLGSLARLKQSDKSVVERFELYIGGFGTGQWFFGIDRCPRTAAAFC